MPLRLPPWAVDAALVSLAALDAVLSAGREGGIQLALSLVAAAALAVRRDRPYVAFALTLPALAMAYVLVAPLAALYTVAATARDRRPVVVCAVLAASAYYLPWPPTALRWDREFRNLLGLIYAVVYVGAPVALGLLTQTRRDLSLRLQQLTEGRDREQRLVAASALAAERARLAREMHDVVSHQVSLIAVQAGALQVTTGDPAAREVAGTIRGLSVRTLDELRHMVGVLRAAGGSAHELAPQPGIADIPRLVAESGQDAQVDVSHAVGQEWPDPVQRAAFRTVQEALTNVGKHAAGAPVRAEVVPVRRGFLRVTVVNGPPPVAASSSLPGGGHGLLGLRERAELLGGTLEAGGTPDGGFRVEMLLPVVEDAARSASGAASARWS